MFKQATDRQYVQHKTIRQIFRIGTVRYAAGLWRMRRHGPVIAHRTDSEDFPTILCGIAIGQIETAKQKLAYSIW